MCTNLHTHGLGGFANDAYWSSSESNQYSAIEVHFNGCFEENHPKDMMMTDYVRAVRAF
jgi:hypothetical protein